MSIQKINRFVAAKHRQKRDILPIISIRTRTSYIAETVPSDTGVPGVASFRRGRAQALAETLHTVGDRQVRDVFHALVAELAGKPHAQWAAVAYGKVTAVHSICEKGLRLHGIGYVDALPPFRIDREIDNVSGFWVGADQIEHMRQWRTDPFSYV